MHEATWSLEAVHDGYLRPFGVLHRRSVSRVAPGHLRIVDRLTGGPHLPVTSRLQLAPGLGLEEEPSGWLVLLDGSPILRVRASPEMERRARHGDGVAPAGWVSGGFLRLSPAFQLEVSGELGPGRSLTVDIMHAGIEWPQGGEARDPVGRR